jgi:hypothetical protein
MPAVSLGLPALVLNHPKNSSAPLVAGIVNQSQAICDDKDIFGDVLCQKSENILRIGFDNIGNLL